MSLQRRLFWLLLAFVAFALLATASTIYAVRLHVEIALRSLQLNQQQAEWVERLRLAMLEQHIQLREVVSGLREPDELYLARRDAFFDNDLGQFVRFMLPIVEPSNADEIIALTVQLRDGFKDVLQGRLVAETANGDANDGVPQGAAKSGGDSDAGTRETPEEASASRAWVLSQKAKEALRDIEDRIIPALDTRLQNVRGVLDQKRAGAVDEVVATNTQALVLALTVAVVGFTLVAVGTLLFRRWTLLPVRRLEAATREFSQGNLGYRVGPTTPDELGTLGNAMDTMAENLAHAQEDLRVSEAKYRALFTNLRDAAILCDAAGRVIECQDGETDLLGRISKTDCVGHSLLELVPTRPSEATDWPALIGRVLTRGERVNVTDVRLPLATEPGPGAIVDLIAFPVTLPRQQAVAIVLRDVTDQRRSEAQLRRTEAMEATVTLARGVAHDFSSLLTGAIGSLSILNSELSKGHAADLARRALRACGQAVSLSRTLLTFAGGDRGSPEVLRLRDTVSLILESLDEAQLEKIRLTTELDGAVCAYVDRDQFTEIVLNLVTNACEAMTGGGELRVRVTRGRGPSTNGSEGPPTHAVISVSDTGPGINPDVQERLFEPFFTTKGNGKRRGRGMGLAVVYAAVKNAGGQVQARGNDGRGATFTVWLPLAETEEPADEPPQENPDPAGAASRRV